MVSQVEMREIVRLTPVGLLLALMSLDVEGFALRNTAYSLPYQRLQDNTAKKRLEMTRMHSATTPTMGYELAFGKDRVALVTGASRGIGQRIAESLAKAGVGHVLCVSRSQQSSGVVADRINSMGGKASAYGVDVGDSCQVTELCDEVLKDFGKIDILVNNAGITRDNLFLRMKASEWEDVIKTNLNPVFYFTSPLVRKMISNRFGRIINMASVVGVGGNAGQANYAASKAGVIGFTRSLAKELASRCITVNAIAPGFIESDMTAAMTDEAKEATLKSIPAGRMGTAQEVADLAVFLASENASYINGKVIPVDGAMLFGGN